MTCLLDNWKQCHSFAKIKGSPIFAWAPAQAWAGGVGHLPFLEKLKSVITQINSISEVSLNGQRLLFSEERRWMIVQHRLLHFCILYKRILYCCTHILKKEGTPDASTRFGIGNGKPMIILSPDFIIYTELKIGGKNRSCCHLEVKNCS